MKTMKWLVQREFWEHKGSIFWAPIAVAAAWVASGSSARAGRADFNCVTGALSVPAMCPSLHSAGDRTSTTWVDGSAFIMASTP